MAQRVWKIRCQNRNRLFFSIQLSTFYLFSFPNNWLPNFEFIRIKTKLKMGKNSVNVSSIEFLVGQRIVLGAKLLDAWKLVENFRRFVYIFCKIGIKCIKREINGVRRIKCKKKIFYPLKGCGGVTIVVSPF